MKNSKKEKSNKQIIITFVAIMVISLCLGIAVGVFKAKADKMGGMDLAVEQLQKVLINVTPMVFIVFCILGIILPVITYVVCKKMHKDLLVNPDDDELWDALEEKLNVPLLISNLFSIVNMCLFFCLIHIVMQTEYLDVNATNKIYVIVSTILFVVSTFVGIAIQGACVKIEKALNPEKKGNILDSNFQKDWFASCDEAQQLMVYKAAYKAFSVTSITCYVVFILAFVLIEFLNLDVLPLIAIGVIMLINNMTYMVEAAKLEKGKN